MSTFTADFNTASWPQLLAHFGDAGTRLTGGNVAVNYIEVSREEMEKFGENGSELVEVVTFKVHPLDVVMAVEDLFKLADDTQVAVAEVNPVAGVQVCKGIVTTPTRASMGVAHGD